MATRFSPKTLKDMTKSDLIELEKNRLEQLDRILTVGYAVIFTVTVALFLDAICLAVDELGLKVLGIEPKYLSTNIRWAVDDKIGSILIEILGFGISLPSQITFPAPDRSFAAVTLFTIKQIMVVFLPKWCIRIVPLFALLAIFTLDWDRKKT
ncbi:unnamed protein product, partial [Adineta steineri]